MGFLHSADDKDKQSVPFALIFGGAFLIAAMGLLFSYLEHTRPLSIFRTETERFAKGSADQLTPSRFRGVYRRIASDINDGIEKVLAKGGAPRRTADLASVLGPIPVQPSMSAFSLPQDAPPPPGGAAGSLDRAARPGADGRAGAVGAAPLFVQPAAPAPLPSPGPAAGAPPPPMPPAPKPMGPPTKVAAPTLVGVAPPAGPLPPPKPAAGRPALGSSPGFTGSGTGRNALGSAPGISSLASREPYRLEQEEDDEATVVSHVPNDILGQLSPDKGTDRPAAIEDEASEWKRVFDEFVRLKRECGEPTDGISFDKFKNTLRKNRDQLLQRHGCKSVKFNVYVKDGKAALKANPVRE